MEKSIYRDENLVLLRLLRQCRIESGMTQGQFAEALGRPQSFASDIERGLRRLDLIQLRDICRVLGLGLRIRAVAERGARIAPRALYISG